MPSPKVITPPPTPIPEPPPPIPIPEPIPEPLDPIPDPKDKDKDEIQEPSIYCEKLIVKIIIIKLNYDWYPGRTKLLIVYSSSSFHFL